MDIEAFAIAVFVVVMLTVAVLWWQIVGDRRLVPYATRRREGRRRIRRIIRSGYPFVMVVVGVVMVVVGIGARILGGSMVWLVEDLGQALVYGGVVLTYVRFFALRRRVERLGFEVCPDCEYRLAGLADRGHCPECGFEYDKETLRAAWEDLWGMMRLFRGKGGGKGSAPEA